LLRESYEIFKYTYEKELRYIQIYNTV